ncbi:hypothetical protein CKW46_17210 [Mycobacterium liflandii]|nr:hypothetical protein CKW46_17210 [Mycobacterium liflandii]GAQ31623.1 hypothetical protein MPS_0004 [Mycobacterium pseudoshottsii JCM 15466]
MHEGRDHAAQAPEANRVDLPGPWAFLCVIAGRFRHGAKANRSPKTPVRVLRPEQVTGTNGHQRTIANRLDDFGPYPGPGNRRNIESVI